MANVVLPNPPMPMIEITAGGSSLRSQCDNLLFVVISSMNLWFIKLYKHVVALDVYLWNGLILTGYVFMVLSSTLF